MENLQTWQTALYGVLVLLLIGIIQIFINQYIGRKNTLEKEKIDQILKLIENISTSVDKLTTTISDMKILNATSSSETHTKLENIYRELDRFDKRIAALEQKITK